MKTLLVFRLAVIAFLMVTASYTVQAQRSTSSIPQEGFWVIETPAKGHECIVRFYTDDQKLIYEETVNRRLNIARQRTKRQLNTALEQTIFVWNATHKIPADRQWVAVQFNVAAGQLTLRTTNK